MQTAMMIGELKDDSTCSSLKETQLEELFVLLECPLDSTMVNISNLQTFIKSKPATGPNSVRGTMIRSLFILVSLAHVLSKTCKSKSKSRTIYGQIQLSQIHLKKLPETRHGTKFSQIRNWRSQFFFQRLV